MANASAGEESCGEKPLLTAEEVSYSAQSSSEPYARFRDFLLVIVGISAIASIFFLITTFHIFPHFASSFSYAHVHKTQAGCHDPPLRREWRALSEEGKMAFIRAVQCLARKPSKLGLNTTRYDDFVYVHVNLYDGTHNVAPSLPWHRYYIKIFENALQEECNFEGYLPYWDWTLDAAAPEDSTIWSVTNGFGGNGTGDLHCLEEGLFLSLKPQYPKKHCLQRDFVPGMVGFNYTAEKILDLWQNTTSYHDFRTHLESGAHKSVHNGIGGEMPTDGSSNDPIFFVHHAQIDRVWWHWQQLQLQQRLEDYFGPNNVSEPDALNQASLQDTLAMMGLDSDLAVSKVMDTRAKQLCYKY